MNETVNQESATNNEQTNEQPRSFSQQELDAIVADRLKRERAKYEGFEDFKAKAQRLDEIEEANKSELDKAHERVSTLEAELNGLKKQAEIRAIREKVAKESGIPAESMSLLTGETEEACLEQAKAILSIAVPGNYPHIPDAGEIQTTNKASARDAFKEWANLMNN